MQALRRDSRDILPSVALSWIFQAYKRKTEAAKKEYLKALAAYRASLVSKVTESLGNAQ